MTISRYTHRHNAIPITLRPRKGRNLRCLAFRTKDADAALEACKSVELGAFVQGKEEFHGVVDAANVGAVGGVGGLYVAKGRICRSGQDGEGSPGEEEDL